MCLTVKEKGNVLQCMYGLVCTHGNVTNNIFHALHNIVLNMKYNISVKRDIPRKLRSVLNVINITTL